MQTLTFTQISDSLPVNRGANFIDIGHEEESEVFHDGSPDSVVRDPFNNRFGFDVAKLFQRQLLSESVRSRRETLSRATHVLDALKIILIPSFIVLPSRPGFELGNAKFIIDICIIFHIVFTTQESGGTTSSRSPCATFPRTLQPISTRHLGFSSTTGGSRHFG